ncbi:MAG: di-trans,poly-cis-decaprenylcistransferase [Geminicoccaceae bacterium]|nr:MAG: di-trans,poly-cis-decaprenylcistransferase [Geminicoccaceae bacterium]
MSSPLAPSVCTNGPGPAIPAHVAIIMDGNRRWAQARGRPALYGHQQGAQAVRRVMEAANELGIRYLTFFAFSAENWNRSADEIQDLMNLLRFYLRREVANLVEHNVRLRFIGDRGSLPDDINQLLDGGLAATRGCTGPVATFALNYGSRQAIVQAARDFALAVARGEAKPDDLTVEGFGRRLTDGVPEPDLLIRTSGEQRLSNFLLWELAYAEFVFTPVNWPAFDITHLRAALDEYGRRERRYGASGG